MGWPYEFADLTDVQKHRRRALLDAYGLIAQSSIGAVLILLQVVFLVKWISQRWDGQQGSNAPSSPGLKHAQKGGRFDIRTVQHWWRCVRWWAEDPMSLFGMNFGTKGHFLAGAAWTVWLLALCSAETGNDYLHLTKRFGIVAASQLPFHYLLIWKSSWSPVQILTRTSHETLNIYHQILGRIITLLILLHSAFYLNFYVQSNLLGNKLKEAYVLCGLAGAIAFTIIGSTSLSLVRQWSYRLFYAVHVVLAIALFPILFFHVSHLRIYLFETIAIYALNVIIRWAFTFNLRGNIRLLPNTSLVEVTIPTNGIHASKRLLDNLRPGHHAYVSLAGNSFLRTFRSNPFTVASVPSTDGHVKFIARVMDGNTARLVSEKSSADAKVKLLVEGSYGLNTHEDQLLQYDRVLFIAGGVGATFVVPLYRQLLSDLSPSKGSHRRQKVSFVWIARSKSEVTWAVPKDERERAGFTERLKICLTHADASNDESYGEAMDYEEGKATLGASETNEGIELEEQEQLLSSHAAHGNGHIGKSDDLPIYTGRPDLRRLVNQALSHGSNERVAIVACGPKGLSRDLRREITPWVKRGRDVWFHDESFSL